MRRLTTASAGLLLTLALLTTATPVRAAELKVDDPAGDATGFDLLGTPEAESTPRPSDAELDILGMSWTSDAKELKLALRLATIGHPVGSAGFTYRLNFTHGGVGYHFLHQVLGPPDAQTVSFVFRNDDGTAIECRCSGKIDGKTSTWHVTAEIASIGKAIKANGGQPIGPGTKFTNLAGSTDRILGFLVAVDYARPAPNTTFTV